MTNKIELIELYLPDSLINWAEITQYLEKLAAFNFVINYGKQLENTLDFDQSLGQYFFNNTNQYVSHAALCAYFCDLDQNQSYWIKADPVQYILDLNKGFIASSEFTVEGSAKFTLLINEFISEDNLEFNIIDKQNALIRSQKPIDYRAPSLINIINQPITFEQITGQDKPYFQKLSTELQLLLNQHKTLETDPSGLYFGGAGELPLDKPKPQYNKIISNDYSVLGLAKLAGVNFEHLDVNQPLNIDFKADEKILINTQDFSLYWRSGYSTEFMNLSLYFDKILLELINLIKNNQLKKLVLNTGEKTYELTKGNIIKSYFTRWFK